ncbi:hypothetical protein BTO06_10295 [Tenacibaculum sp. SZ-18]|nr:hypothetical protein BTO06_10295 [Tenacibaculum sp. SZ-18]
MFGQKDTLNYTKEILKKDISNLLTLTEFNYGVSEEIIKRAKPIGYIGNNYQRFQIQIISVIKNQDIPSKYFVYGKTKVKNNICEFQGNIIIENVKIFSDLEFPEVNQGIIKGKYKFFENINQKGSGVFNGVFETNFYIDKNGLIQYNALMFSADGFYNNMFQGTWISYKNGKSKKCNWGDYRIPDSGKLDIGVAEFGPNPDYNQFGWENYKNAHFSNGDKGENAKEIENRKWWIGEK